MNQLGQMDMHRELSVALEALDGYKKIHLELAKRMIAADGGSVYPMDLFVGATLNRSLNTLDGFVSLIRARNFVAAAPLVRLQLDTCLRLSAAFLVDEPHQFVLEVINGKRIRDMCDQSGKKMTDRYLCDQLAEEAPWIDSVYKHASGYIHLSNKHFYESMRVEEGAGTIQHAISLGDSFVSDKLRLDAVAAFQLSTNLQFEYVEGWIYSKANPDLIKKARQQTP